MKKNLLRIRDFQNYNATSRDISAHRSRYLIIVVVLCLTQNLTSFQSPDLHSGLNRDSTGSLTCDVQNKLTWAQPGDIYGLKRQLVKLLDISGGGLHLARLQAEYQRIYGRPLFVSVYGAVNLINLVRKMPDAIVIEGNSPTKFVYNRNSKAGPGTTRPPVILSRRDKKGKDLEDVNNDIMGETGAGS